MKCSRHKQLYVNRKRCDENFPSPRAFWMERCLSKRQWVSPAPLRTSGSTSRRWAPCIVLVPLFDNQFLSLVVRHYASVARNISTFTMEFPNCGRLFGQFQSKFNTDWLIFVWFDPYVYLLFTQSSSLNNYNVAVVAINYFPGAGMAFTCKSTCSWICAVSNTVSICILCRFHCHLKLRAFEKCKVFII